MLLVGYEMGREWASQLLKSLLPLPFHDTFRQLSLVGSIPLYGVQIFLPTISIYLAFQDYLSV